MNAIWLLMGLLLLSYIGSFLVGGRAIRGAGLPSGVEYVVLGFLIGPSALGVLERSALDLFTPFAQVALGWLMFVIGLTYGRKGERQSRLGRLTTGWFAALATAALVAAATWIFLSHWTPLDRKVRILLAGGVGIASCETTRYAVRWVVDRHRAAGPLSSYMEDMAESDDFVVLLGVAAVFAQEPLTRLPIPMPWWGWVGITIGLGVVLGGIAAILLGGTFRVAETWSVLLGTSLLTVGVSTRLGTSAVTAMFIFGVTLASLSPHRTELIRLAAPTERPVMLPALLLAGAHVDFGAAPYLPLVIAIAIAARVLAKGLVGLAIVTVSKSARPAGRQFGLGLLSAGALSMSIGLAFALRFPGPVGDVVLATAAAVALFGEFVGPTQLRKALERAGETHDEAPTSGLARAGGIVT